MTGFAFATEMGSCQIEILLVFSKKVEFLESAKGFKWAFLKMLLTWLSEMEFRIRLTRISLLFSRPLLKKFNFIIFFFFYKNSRSCHFRTEYQFQKTIWGDWLSGLRSYIRKRKYPRLKPTVSARF